MGAEPGFKLHPSDPQTPALSLLPLPDVDTSGSQVHVILKGPQQDWERGRLGVSRVGEGCEEEGSRDSLGL